MTVTESVSDRIRAQQAGADLITPEEVARAFNAMLDAHKDHEWVQIGPCVYCDDCNTRLFQGRLGGERKERDSRPVQTPKETRDMRARWGKD